MINTPKIYKMRIVFYLAPNALAREDIVGTLRKMILSSQLDYARSKSSPHVPRVAYGPCVKRGQLAQREYADIYLLTSVSVQQVRERLEASKPQGLELIDVYRVPYTMASVQQLATSAVYQAQGDFSAYAPQQTFENYAAARRLEVVRHAENGVSITTDLKPFLVNVKTLNPQFVQFTVTSVAEKWVNPWMVLYGWLGKEIPASEEQIAIPGITLVREGLYWKDSQDNLHLI